jgi:hypothetical protein
LCGVKFHQGGPLPLPSLEPSTHREGTIKRPRQRSSGPFRSENSLRYSARFFSPLGFLFACYRSNFFMTTLFLVSFPVVSPSLSAPLKS